MRTFSNAARREGSSVVETMPVRRKPREPASSMAWLAPWPPKGSIYVDCQ